MWLTVHESPHPQEGFEWFRQDMMRMARMCIDEPGMEDFFSAEMYLTRMKPADAQRAGLVGLDVSATPRMRFRRPGECEGDRGGMLRCGAGL